jgi:putative endonuclease
MPRWPTSWLKRGAADAPLGRRGEDAAARFLRGRGYKILLRNFRCAMGEVDIIAKHAHVLVFVEVKTREDDEPAPEVQVNRTKQHQLTKAAKFYLSRYPQLPAARFDVVAVVWPAGGKPVIRHTVDAFTATF